MSHSTKRTTIIVLVGIVALFLAVVLLPALLRTFAAGMRGDFDPTPKERIDPVTCELVLTANRAESFLKCPITKDTRIPNWPDKKAPLNK